MIDSITITCNGETRTWVKNPVEGTAAGKHRISELVPGDWWVKDYVGVCCSYVFLRSISEQECIVLITRSDGKIWVSTMYDVDGKVEI